MEKHQKNKFKFFIYFYNNFNLNYLKLIKI